MSSLPVGSYGNGRGHEDDTEMAGGIQGGLQGAAREDRGAALIGKILGRGTGRLGGGGRAPLRPEPSEVEERMVARGSGRRPPEGLIAESEIHGRMVIGLVHGTHNLQYPF